MIPQHLFRNSLTTHAEFDSKTDAIDVAKAFPRKVQGKTILVTGVNKTGLGFSALHAFASQSPAHLILASRSSDKIKECIDALKAEFPNVKYHALNLDLSTQKSVRAAASELLSWDEIDALDIVVNCAAVFGFGETQRTVTDDGLELHFATNHIGHWLFTNLIMPKIIKAATRNPKGATRVINVSSGSPFTAGIRWSDINFEKMTKDLPEDEQPSEFLHKMFGMTINEETVYTYLEAYNQSKVANVLFTVAANARLYEKYGIVALSLHPGIIRTELGRNATKEQREIINDMKNDYKTLSQGSSTTLVAALDPKVVDGLTAQEPVVFLADCKMIALPPKSSSKENAERLWSLSEELTQEKFSW
ncbi:NAD(P)-binding protein [Periconia macrospinosa]|uniref:NAD(P)-binding protein n=1 Tax=Periconia macrospinosa TaxID=97972 RepID=A0A2V1E808_9PLEO|nr:NAD(P)-binding protein [Periconia macrospinosa]